MEKSAKLPSMIATFSGFRPGNFPLRSLESRAAARMLVAATRSKSQPGICSQEPAHRQAAARTSRD